MYTWFPFRPVKGVAYRLYFYINSASGVDIDQTSISNWNIRYISKDFGALTLLTNTPVLCDNSGASGSANGFCYIDLTATEMNANVIHITLNAGGINEWLFRTIIFTDGYEEFSESSGGGGGGLSQSDLIDGEEILPAGSPTIGDIFRALHFYLRKYRNRRNP